MPDKLFKQRLKIFAQENRKYGTKGEAILWKYILSKKQTGYQFNRQYIIDKYIVDFISRKLKLIIEIDGNSHNIKENNNDLVRQSELEDLGYIFLRFSERQVVKQLYDVYEAIEFAIYSIESSSQVD